MGWEEYYERVRPISFKDQLSAYRLAMKFASERVSKVLDPAKSLTFILGGFHPFSGTPEAFKSFCLEIHSNPHDKHLIMDMNLSPLTEVSQQLFPHRVQGRLETLPFQPETVNFFFLDFTLDFMNDQQVREFAKEASFCLAPNGLVVAAVDEPLILGLPAFSKMTGYLANWVEKFS